MAIVRTFVAIHLSDALQDALRRTQAILRTSHGGSAGRYVSPENIHLTLKFLGDVDSSLLPAVYQSVAAVAARHEPFSLSLAGLGCFPNVKRPRVIWAGVATPGPQLTAMATDLDSALNRLGFARERRPFQAHLTLARIKRGADPAQAQELAQCAVAQRAPDGVMKGSEIAVVRSDLRPEGPIYSDLFVARLGQAKPR